MSSGERKRSVLPVSPSHRSSRGNDDGYDRDDMERRRRRRRDDEDDDKSELAWWDEQRSKREPAESNSRKPPQGYVSTSHRRDRDEHDGERYRAGDRGAAGRDSGRSRDADYRNGADGGNGPYHRADSSRYYDRAPINRGADRFDRRRGSFGSAPRASLDEPEEGEISLNYSDEPPKRPSDRERRPERDQPRSIPREPVTSKDTGRGQEPYSHERFSASSKTTAAQATPSSSVVTAPSATTVPRQSQAKATEEQDMELEIPKPIDPDALIAERRRKRAEILAKYSSSATGAGSSTPNLTDQSRLATPEVTTGVNSTMTNASGSRNETPGRTEMERDTKRIKLGTDIAIADSPETGHSRDDQTADQAFDLFKDANENEAARIGEQDAAAHVQGEEEINAADYNPNEDRKNDDRRFALKTRDGHVVDEKKVSDTAVKNEVVVGDDDDDDDDMFAIGHKVVVDDDDAKDRNKVIPIINRADALPGLTDNFDDEEGYYRVVLGELLDDGRYHVHANLGKGMFSSVVRAKDMQSTTGEEVAIKLIRSQESMFKAGQKEAGILRKLREADPEDKKHLIRMHRTFEHRGHLCLVFESMSMNLREVVKRFGKDVGINLRAVRAYASQLFLALALMRRCDIMHADIKPDNVLVNESKSTLKLSDLGSASDVTENDITPYLVSRFYRAPEIILGLPYDFALDTWSIACTLYELYTGKILFPGRTNNHMLLLVMELKGKFNHKQLKKGKFTDQHFDDSLNFLSLEKSGEIKTKVIPSRPTHDLRSRLMPTTAMKKLREEEVKLLGQFVDLLDKMLSLDPSKRPTPKEMLNHPFIRG
ncbi:U4/U6 small nuclear ribonucleoprotein prp4 [Microbotryomycetes sp. JL221]|nr:U4/U6 small nuclear ribonucleoprotein prp4 [Microbotryomycetes sp. JL221]